MIPPHLRFLDVFPLNNSPHFRNIFTFPLPPQKTSGIFCVKARALYFVEYTKLREQNVGVLKCFYRCAPAARSCNVSIFRVSQLFFSRCAAAVDPNFVFAFLEENWNALFCVKRKGFMGRNCVPNQGCVT